MKQINVNITLNVETNMSEQDFDKLLKILKVENFGQHERNEINNKEFIEFIALDVRPIVMSSISTEETIIYGEAAINLTA